MNRLDHLFESYRRAGKKALIGYLMAGYPTKASFVDQVHALEKAGLDCLEIGVPFSDPIADGPTIQEAGQKALLQGVTLSWVLSQVQAIRKQSQMPIILMTYINPILQKGVDAFCKAANAAGVDGLIIPDVIPEEAAAFETSSAKHGLDLIYLAAPTTPKERLPSIGRKTRGFLYAVSLTGVTGARQSIDPGASRFLQSLRQYTRVPVCVGFGISTPKHVQAVRKAVDGVIVGSALLKAVTASRAPQFENAVQFVKSLKAVL